MSHKPYVERTLSAFETVDLMRPCEALRAQKARHARLLGLWPGEEVDESRIDARRTIQCLHQFLPFLRPKKKVGAVGEEPLSSLPAALDKELSKSLVPGICCPVKELPVPRIDSQIDLLLTLRHFV